MNIKNANIGVIGYGNFGKVVCNDLFPNNAITLYSKGKNLLLSKRISLAKSLEKLVEKSDIIIPCVPIRVFEETIKEIAKHIKPSTIVIDICSVKEYPVSIMKKYLPKNIPVIASHPMFGLNSIKKRGYALNGLKMVLWNISIQSKIFDAIAMHFRNMGINVIEMSPTQHDMLSANSQFFALCIRELAQRLSLKPNQIDTPGAEAIFDALQYMGADKHIIEDMIQYNIYCKKVLEEMLITLTSLKEQGEHV